MQTDSWRWPSQGLADAVLAIHAGIVVFVVAGLILVVAGNLRGWRWVNAFWFRLLHLGAILVVVAESWFGIVCPLTSLENWLRLQAHAGGDAGGYAGSFVEHWLQRLLYWQAPAWVFTLAYSLFGLAVVASWWRYPPRRDSRRAG